MTPTTFFLHGEPDGEHMRVEVTAARVKVILQLANHEVINAPIDRFKPLWPHYQDRVALDLSHNEFSRIVEHVEHVGVTAVKMLKNNGEGSQ